jgi:hypothetical protein
VNSYIVRIYRQNKKDPQKLVGIVEEVGVKGKRGFVNIEDLWDILCAAKGGPRAIRKDGQKDNKLSSRLAGQ